jgi:hypothetical protein
LTEYKGKLYLLGGSSGATSELWILDYTSAVWTRVYLSGMPNLMRHTSVCINGSVYVFGGVLNMEPQTRLFCIDLVKQKCREIFAPKPLKHRSQHSAVALDGKMLVFGGKGTHGIFFDDVWVFEPASESWAEIVAPGGPCPRAGAVMACSPAGEVIIWGGFGNSSFEPDLFILNLQPDKKPAWEVSPGYGAVPSRRHSAISAKIEDKLYLYGGESSSGVVGDLFCLEMSSRSWSRCADPSPFPVRSGGDGAIVMDSQGRPILVGFGGKYDPVEAKKCTDDCVCIPLYGDLNFIEGWSVEYEKSDEKLSSYNFAALRCQVTSKLTTDRFRRSSAPAKPRQIITAPDQPKPVVEQNLIAAKDQKRPVYSPGSVLDQDGPASASVDGSGSNTPTQPIQSEQRALGTEYDSFSLVGETPAMPSGETVILQARRPSEDISAPLPAEPSSRPLSLPSGPNIAKAVLSVGVGHRHSSPSRPAPAPAEANPSQPTPAPKMKVKQPVEVEYVQISGFKFERDKKEVTPPFTCSLYTVTATHLLFMDGEEFSILHSPCLIKDGSSLYLVDETGKVVKSFQLKPHAANEAFFKFYGSLRRKLLHKILDGGGSLKFQLLSPTGPDAGCLILQKKRFSLPDARKNEVREIKPKNVKAILFRGEKNVGLEVPSKSGGNLICHCENAMFLASTFRDLLQKKFTWVSVTEKKQSDSPRQRGRGMTVEKIIQSIGDDENGDDNSAAFLNAKVRQYYEELKMRHDKKIPVANKPLSKSSKQEPAPGP